MFYTSFVFYLKRILNPFVFITLTLTFLLFCIPHTSSSYAQSISLKVGDPSDSTVKGIPHPFLWEITPQKGKKSYLFGTIHIPDPRFKDLHPHLNQIFQEADAVYGELDLFLAL